MAYCERDGDVDVWRWWTDRCPDQSHRNSITCNICISKFQSSRMLLIWPPPEANFSIKFLCLIWSQAMGRRNEKLDTRKWPPSCHVTNEYEKFVDSLLAVLKCIDRFKCDFISFGKSESASERNWESLCLLTFRLVRDSNPFRYISLPEKCTPLFTFHIFIYSSRWHRKDDTAVVRNKSKHMHRRNPHATCTATYSIGSNGLGKWKWHTQLTFDETNCYFSLLGCLSFCLLSSHWFIADCAMVYAVRRTVRASARVQHLFYYKNENAHAQTTHAHTHLAGSWSTVCDLSCAFFRHVCVTLRRRGAATVNLFAQRKVRGEWKRQCVSCVARPKTIFKKRLMKRRCRWWRRTQDPRCR